MLGTALGTGLKAVGSIFGGIAAARAAKRAKKIVENQKKANEDWYNREYNTDYTQRLDAQEALRQNREVLREALRGDRATSAVAGGTEESSAALKQAGVDATAKATGDIAIAGEAQKAAIQQQHNSRADSYAQQLANIEQNKAQNLMQAATGAANAGAQMVDAFGGGSTRDLTAELGKIKE